MQSNNEAIEERSGGNQSELQPEPVLIVHFMIVTPEPVLLSDLRTSEERPVIRAVSVQRTDDRPWLGVLRLAVMEAMWTDEWINLGKPLDVVTSWDPRIEALTRAADPDKHRLYSGYILAAIDAGMPGLLFLLRAAGATLYASPGACSFNLPGDREMREIPELLHLTELLPWKTEHDGMNIQ